MSRGFPCEALVDQLDSRRPSSCNVGVDVRDLVGDVVQAGPVLREELAHGGVAAERREQLHVVLADVEQHRLNALLRDYLAMGDDQLKAVPLQR